MAEDKLVFTDASKSPVYKCPRCNVVQVKDSQRMTMMDVWKDVLQGHCPFCFKEFLTDSGVPLMKKVE